jgi:TRAP-type uncharacterized transport system fused permease subunit
MAGAGPFKAVGVLRECAMPSIARSPTVKTAFQTFAVALNGSIVRARAVSPRVMIAGGKKGIFMNVRETGK